MGEIKVLRPSDSCRCLEEWIDVDRKALPFPGVNPRGVLVGEELEVDLLSKDVTDDGLLAVLRLKFMNNELKSQSWGQCQERHHLPISLSTLLHIYPFSVILNKNMRIEYVGSSLSQLGSHMVMKKFNDVFKMENHKSSILFHEVLERPDIIYNVSISDVRRNIERRLHLKGKMWRRNVSFNLHAFTFDPKLMGLKKNVPCFLLDNLYCRLRDIYASHPVQCTGTSVSSYLQETFLGQMIHLNVWQMLIFLGTPLIPTLDFVMDIGLFLNDLPMHDFSRDNVLTGTQESSELRLSLETEQEKTAKIQEAMRRLDEEVNRTNRLLYQMIPQHVTEQLKTGKSPMVTCTDPRAQCPKCGSHFGWVPGLLGRCTETRSKTRKKS